jgi:hypothetical protein
VTGAPYIQARRKSLVEDVKMLHVTNGDSAVERLRAAGITGEILPWRDVLHDGPVPEGKSADELRALRASFIAAQFGLDPRAIEREFEERDETLARFRDHDEVVLWFEHDLYDQLQLLQLLDWFSERPLGRTRLSQVASDDYLGSMPQEEIRRRFEARETVSPQQITLARQGWAAFRAPDPRALETFVARGDELHSLPFLQAALRRQLQELPDAHSGLSRTERQALEAIASGRSELRDVYPAAHHQREEAIYLGDSSFAHYLELLSGPNTPLVTLEDGSPLRTPRGESDEEFWHRRVTLTDAGRAVLAGTEDRVRLLGIDRWLGGVHLFGHAVPWRWDGGRVRVADG